MGLSGAKRVLLCLRYGIGDVIMQLPALTALRRGLPEAHITAVGARPAIDLLENDRRVDALVNVHEFGLGHWGDYGDERIRSGIGQWLRDGEYQAVLDASNAAMGFGQAVWEVVPDRVLETGNGLADELIEKTGSGHTAIAEAARRGWGIDVPADVRPRLEMCAEERRFAANLFASNGLETGCSVALSPVASSPLKRWPVERLAAVGREVLARDERARIIIIPGDQRRLGRTVEMLIGCSPKTFVVPALHLRRTGAVLEGCRAVVSNDTGLMHLAAAVGAPTVGVFGPTATAIATPPEAAGVGSGIPCEHRLEQRFGPPSCLIEGRCLLGYRSCIDEVGTQSVCDALDRVMQRDERAIVGERPGGIDECAEPHSRPR